MTDENLQKLRLMRAQLGFLQKSDGSCNLEQGNTVIWCNVNGPGDCVSSKRLNNKLYVEVVYRCGKSNCNTIKANRLLKSVIEQTVQSIRFPRAMLAVTIQELQIDGSNLAAALNASCLALLDSGISMNGIFCGVNICDLNGKLMLDPNLQFCQKASSQFTFAVKCSNFLWKTNSIRVVACDTDGVFNYATFEAAQELAIESANEIFMFYRETMQRKLNLSC
uniref:RNase_PH domain-containing protein n=1 Tax=Syphacia muris TaxID=451379 RepID=A0A0N5ALD9_9BILA